MRRRMRWCPEFMTTEQRHTLYLRYHESPMICREAASETVEICMYLKYLSACMPIGRNLGTIRYLALLLPRKENGSSTCFAILFIRSTSALGMRLSGCFLLIYVEVENCLALDPRIGMTASASIHQQRFLSEKRFQCLLLLAVQPASAQSGTAVSAWMKLVSYEKLQDVTSPAPYFLSRNEMIAT